MKQLILQTLIIAIAIITLNAQTPEAFKYQAVARGTNGQPLTNQAISLRISILQTSASGTTVYAETHSATTNDFGLFALNIGEGTMETGNFSTIDWGADNYFIQVEMDETGGTSYNLMGTSQLLSVPYALYAESANTVANDQVDDADADPANELQTLSTVGNQLTISNGNTVTLTDEVDDADADPSNELQVLSISNDTIYLSDGGYVDLGINYMKEFQFVDLSTTGVGFMTNTNLLNNIYQCRLQTPDIDRVLFTLYIHMGYGVSYYYDIVGAPDFITKVNNTTFDISPPGYSLTYRLEFGTGLSTASIRTVTGVATGTTILTLKKVNQ